MVGAIFFSFVLLGFTITTLLARKHCRPQRVKLRQATVCLQPVRRRQDW